MEITSYSDLRAYFFERLRSAQQRRRRRTDGVTEYYLVDLLARFGGGEATPEEQPLTVAVAEAAEAPEPTERFQRFRLVGDTALYTCGLFPEGLDRRGVSQAYVTAVGRRAYGHAGALARYSGEQFSDVYPRLRRDFEDLIELLANVFEAPTPSSPDQIIRIYSRWKRSGSAKLAAQLRAAGVPIDDDTLH